MDDIFHCSYFADVETETVKYENWNEDYEIGNDNSDKQWDGGTLTDSPYSKYNSSC